MTHEQFVHTLERLQAWADRHAEEMRLGEFLVEVDPQEWIDRQRAREYCRRNGLPVPVLLEMGGAPL
jgi:hypothetical protein